MSNDDDAFIGEIRIFPFAFAPKGWAACDGQLLTILQNTALYSVIGNSFGGDGSTTFALPNLQGSVPVGQGQGRGLSNYVIGQSTGSDRVTLQTSELPSHNHAVRVQTVDQGDNRIPGPSLNLGNTQIYRGDGTPVPMHLATVVDAGGGASHNNLMPYLSANFCICISGQFPKHAGDDEVATEPQSA